MATLAIAIMVIFSACPYYTTVAALTVATAVTAHSAPTTIPICTIVVNIYYPKRRHTSIHSPRGVGVRSFVRRCVALVADTVRMRHTAAASHVHHINVRAVPVHKQRVPRNRITACALPRSPLKRLSSISRHRLRRAKRAIISTTSHTNCDGGGSSAHDDSNVNSKIRQYSRGCWRWRWW